MVMLADSTETRPTNSKADLRDQPPTLALAFTVVTGTEWVTRKK